MTQEELAEKSNLTRRYLHDIEAGIKYPSLEKLHEIAIALSVKTGSLIKDL